MSRQQVKDGGRKMTKSALFTAILLLAVALIIDVPSGNAEDRALKRYVRKISQSIFLKLSKLCRHRRGVCYSLLGCRDDGDLICEKICAKFGDKKAIGKIEEQVKEFSQKKNVFVNRLLLTIILQEGKRRKEKRNKKKRTVTKTVFVPKM